jgi:hypothetical protein
MAFRQLGSAVWIGPSSRSRAGLVRQKTTARTGWSTEYGHMAKSTRVIPSSSVTHHSGLTPSAGYDFPAPGYGGQSLQVYQCTHSVACVACPVTQLKCVFGRHCNALSHRSQDALCQIGSRRHNREHYIARFASPHLPLHPQTPRVLKVTLPGHVTIRRQVMMSVGYPLRFAQLFAGRIACTTCKAVGKTERSDEDGAARAACSTNQHGH